MARHIFLALFLVLVGHHGAGTPGGLHSIERITGGPERGREGREGRREGEREEGRKCEISVEGGREGGRGGREGGREDVPMLGRRGAGQCG